MFLAVARAFSVWAWSKGPVLRGVGVFVVGGRRGAMGLCHVFLSWCVTSFLLMLAFVDVVAGLLARSTGVVWSGFAGKRNCGAEGFLGRGVRCGLCRRVSFVLC